MSEPPKPDDAPVFRGEFGDAAPPEKPARRTKRRLDPATTLADVSLPLRAKRTLCRVLRHGVEDDEARRSITLAEVATLRRSDLLRRRNFARKSLRDIEAVLRKAGLALAVVEPPAVRGQIARRVEALGPALVAEWGPVAGEVLARVLESIRSPKKRRGR